MANWHVRALMQRRNDYESEEYTKDFDIAMAVAIQIGEDDSPAVMSIGRIASLASCHYNTADRRTKALAAEGKLVIGPGRGKLLAYSLPFEARRERRDERAPTPPATEANSGDFATLRKEVTELHATVKQLTQMVRELHSAITLSSHSHHTDFTLYQGDYVKKEEKKRRREEGNGKPGRGVVLPARAEKPTPTIGGFDPELFELETARQEMVAAIAAEVRETPALGVNQDRFNGAADGLIAAGHTPADIRGFDAWWQENGWYKNRSKAALEHFLEHLSSFRQGISLKTARASPNGKHPAVSGKNSVLDVKAVEGEF